MRPYLRQMLPALRVLIALSIVLGGLYPLLVLGIGQLPGLRSHADGSLVDRHGSAVGSAQLGQSFTDAHGKPVLKYFQPRPSAAGDGYDPTSSGASNLGPESDVDAPDAPSLLTQVCTRSHDLGATYGVDGGRPYCTSGGVGAVLAVFHAGPGYHGRVTHAVSVNQLCPARPFVSTYQGAPVRCAAKGGDYTRGQIVPVRGSAPAHPAVPADAVTASGSGLDPDISPAFARLQERVVAHERGVPVARVAALVRRYTDGRELGFVGESTVNVLALNLALDRELPAGR